MSKNVLVTGLILGNGTDMCQCSNVNFGWLFSNPTDLLWADSIILTKNEWQQITDNNDESPFMKSVVHVFQRLNDKGLVSIISDREIDKDLANSLHDALIADLDLMSDMIVDDDSSGETMMKIGEYSYCIPALWTLYASMYLSYIHNASFSMTSEEYAYMSKLLPRKYYQEIQCGRNIAVEEVLSLYLPKMELWHPIIVDKERGNCDQCMHLNNCNDSYLHIIDKQLDRILEIRSYDEIRMTCDVLDKICERNASLGTVLTGDELWKDLQDEASAIERKARKTIKKINTWQKVSTVASIGFGVSAFFAPVLGIAAAAVPAVTGSVLTDMSKKLEKDMSWVNFVNNPEGTLSNKPLLI